VLRGLPASRGRLPGDVRVRCAPALHPDAGRATLYSNMVDPLAPTAGVIARFGLAAALIAAVWLVVVWAL